MNVVVRTYSGPGSTELFTLLDERKAEIEKALRSVTGFESYTLARMNEGGLSVTVCQDKRGTDESVQVARDWIAANAPNIHPEPPKVFTGTVIIHATK